jgi:hypothetical protein
VPVRKVVAVAGRAEAILGPVPYLAEGIRNIRKNNGMLLAACRIA